MVFEIYTMIFKGYQKCKMFEGKIYVFSALDLL